MRFASTLVLVSILMVRCNTAEGQQALMRTTSGLTAANCTGSKQASAETYAGMRGSLDSDCSHLAAEHAASIR